MHRLPLLPDCLPLQYSQIPVGFRLSADCKMPALCTFILPKGEIPGCCSYCPTGATVFGPTNELLAEAKRRQQMEPGKYYDFPVASLSSGKTYSQKAARYIPQIYGENEVGGTQVLMLSGVPFDMVGMPELPEKSYASTAESIQHTLYKGMIAPIVVLAGLFFFVNRSQRDKD